MKALFIAAIATCVSLAGFSAASAGEAPPAESSCAPKCTHTVTTREVVGYQEKFVKVPVYKYHKKVVKDDCCAPPVATQPVKIPEAPPQVVEVKKKIIVVEKPEIIRVPAPPIVVQEAPRPRFVERPPIVIAPPPPAVVHRQRMCCPPGMHTSNLPPCRTGFAGDPPGISTTRIATRIAGAALGTPGGGYVPGAPQSPEECRARGGIDTGRGCQNYR